MKGQCPRPLDEGDKTDIAVEFGGARRDRTVDLNTASVALSQLSYDPTYKYYITQNHMNQTLMCYWLCNGGVCY